MELSKSENRDIKEFLGVHVLIITVTDFYPWALTTCDVVPLTSMIQLRIVSTACSQIS